MIFNLSKSQFVKGDQCEKALWLYRNRPDLKPELTEDKLALFKKGHLVGGLAQRLYPTGVEDLNMQDAVERTQDLILGGQDVIFEATAVSPDGVFSRIDILRKVEGSDLWDMIEVKSSTSLKDYHIGDLAVQRYAFEGAGFQIRKSILLHLKRGTYFNVSEDSDAKEIFEEHDCTDAVREAVQRVGEKALSLVEAVSRPDEPEIRVGSQCTNPFECEYLEYCNKKNSNHD